MSAVLDIPTARVFKPLLVPARYKAAWGGRGSGKSHFFADLMVEDSLAEPGVSGEGLRSVCIREVQKDLTQSAKLLIEDKLATHRLGQADGFKVFKDVIETPRDGVIIFKGMQDYTAESVKSLEKFKRAWWEEAQTASLSSLNMLRPTIRAEDSEIWFSWNSRRKTDPVDMLFKGKNLPTGAIVVRANWSDNPWFPSVLERERQDCLRDNPEQYDHIWEGGYVTVLAGAYYARCLAEAKAKGRIGNVAADPLMTIRLFVDIGGTGARADAFVIWVAQFVGREIRVLDYYETVGQPLGAHLEWCRQRDYTPNRAQFWLPHDGDSNDKVYDVSYASALREAGYEVTVVPNQGKGAAAARIEAARRLFLSIWFNEATTKPGLEALGWYHEKRDETRNIGLGPDHDWSSHGCFHPHAEVLTRYGTQPISELPEEGEVLTPCGWKRYIYPRITRRDAPLVEVVFTGGYSVKCTPDHLFLTENGWKSAASLTPNTVIQSTLTRSRSISTAVFTVFGRVKRIYREAGRSCIEMLGRLHSGLFPLAATSTIGTETHSIIDSKIWSASQPVSICPNLGLSESAQKVAGSPHLRETRQQIGIDRLKAGCGTSDTPNVPRVGQSGSAKSVPANIAGSPIWPWSARAATPANSVRKSARSLLIALAESRTNGLPRIARVKRLSETSDVWDITVPDGHCFSLANGAVVHNSDAFGLMCVVYEVPEIEAREQEERYGKVRGGWMSA